MQPGLFDLLSLKLNGSLFNRKLMFLAISQIQWKGQN